jgi:DNA (cytosine-5)-methyltransferase 1
MHWPEAIRHNDVRHVGAAELDEVEVICGGFPCQDVSIAGKNAGLDGHRSGLWGEFARIIGELRPRIVVVENVPALVSRGLDRVAADLDGLRYRVEACILAASDVGAPHRRERLFIVAHSGSVGRGERRQDEHDDRSHASGNELDGRRASSGRMGRAASRVGRVAHGIPAGMDRWPAGPSHSAAVWEPKRLASASSPTRARRIGALGNAVVPQVAYQVGLRVREIMSRHIE